MDLRAGYASFDGADEARAVELYKTEGVRLRCCRDLDDEGVVVAGAPLGVEFDRDQPVN